MGEQIEQKADNFPQRWKPGKSGNPAGRPAAGMQSFKDRLSYWLDNKTLKELKTLVDGEDEKRLDKLPAIDVMVIQRVRAACKKDGGQDFVMILDRLLGKPAITADLNVSHALASRLDQAEKLLTDNSAPLIEGKAQILNSVILTQTQILDDELMPGSQGFDDLI